MRRDQAFVDRAGDERRDVRAGPHPVEQVQPPGSHVRDARRELEAEQVAEREHVVGDAAAVGVVALDIELRAVVKQNIERSEEHTSELQSLMRITYAVFCLKNKNRKH